MELTPDQQVAFDAFLEHQVTFVSGPAGTGKSYLIRHIQTHLTQRGIPYMTLSSTGISAHHIEGMTVHSFLCRLRLKVIEMTPETVLIVDEISMLGKKIMDTFEYQLRKHFCIDAYFDPRDKRRPFGGCKVCFFGDFAQLPPINDVYCFESEAWTYLDAHTELTTVKRQNDDTFKTFLAHVRTGKLLREDKETMENMCRTRCETSTHLFQSNKEAEEFNQAGLDRLVSTNHATPILFQATHELVGFTELELDQFYHDRHQMYRSLPLCVDAIVMLTSNLDVANGWCNGTLGHIVSIQGDNVIMQNKKGMTMLIPRKTYLRQRQRVECNVVIGGKKRMCGSVTCDHTPVYTYMDDEIEKSEAYLTVTQYPLVLAWGITIHKSQGMTLDSCTITLPYLYSPSLIYVALSRCVAMDRICLKTQGPIRYDQIVPSMDVMRHIFKWEERECKICKERYVGPYASFCQDCCSAPGKYSMSRFIDFIDAANPSPAMQDYRMYAIKNPTKSHTTKWKKFVAFCSSSFFS